MGTFDVQPTGWGGNIVLSGAQAFNFSIVNSNGTLQLQAANVIGVGEYDLTATAVP